MSKRLMKGNEAVIHGALLGGATHFFGYPITPASEIAHAAAQYFTGAGRSFLQAESEVAAVNMLYGAAGAGARVMTASSGPGIALMSEGLSYIAGAELPCVVVDVQRAGPGLGNIWPEQSDYNMVVKGGGHGNYKNIVLAPNSAQEMCDITRRAFDIADHYRMTVFILSDAYIGQMMEPVEIDGEVHQGKRKEWAVYGDAESRNNLITSIHMNPKLQSDFNEKLQRTYERVEQEAVEYEEYQLEDAEIIFIAYGITSRICMSAVDKLREDGVKAGMLRLISLFPFPKKRIRELAEAQGTQYIISAELSNGQMAEDVRSAVNGKLPVDSFEWLGGIIPGVDEVVQRCRQLMQDRRGSLESKDHHR
ncbi:MAG: 3-methyl-2-oxobutanoate dehydrogenase subunit VorB [Spirochaetales bacterium]|nr:3-methyl-2-oxobutanoate dehydrogenase subunit VorB [Spirochaetales bacterium]